MRRALLVLGATWTGLLLLVSSCGPTPALADSDSWMRPFLSCVAEHESHGNPLADNSSPDSTASGLYGIIDSTWQGNARYASHNGKHVARKYRRAKDAPAWVQKVVALHSLSRGGVHHWDGTHCGFGT